MPPKKRFGEFLNAACTPEMKAEVATLAEKQDRDPSAVIRAAVQLYINKEKGRKRG